MSDNQLLIKNAIIQIITEYKFHITITYYMILTIVLYSTLGEKILIFYIIIIIIFLILKKLQITSL